MTKTHRFKPDWNPGVFHCLCATKEARPMLGPEECAAFYRIMRGHEKFTGSTVLTYAILPNRFHLLLRVQRPGRLSDAELLERVSAVDDEKRRDKIASLLADRKTRENIRQRLLERMGDISIFQKDLKLRFSQWYNSTNQWFGTIWEGRFRSIFVEPAPDAMAAAAAFIDLIPAREGIDPEEYPFCGYGEAVAGGAAARRGLSEILGVKDSPATLDLYAALLDGEEDGEPAGPLTCRRRPFTRDIALGHPDFVRKVFAATGPR